MSLSTQVLRSEVTQIQLQLVESRVDNADLLHKLARAGGKAAPLLVKDTQPSRDSDGRDPALSEMEQANASLKEAAIEAQYLEHQARGLLAAARQESQARQRALLHQMRRMAALEAMRLADLQELHKVERLQTRRDEIDETR